MKRRTAAILVLLAAWASLAIVFGFFDLDISKAAVDRQAAWAVFLHRFGEIPGYALIFILAAIFLGGFFREPLKQKLPAALITIGGLCTAGAGALLGQEKVIAIGAAGAAATAAMTVLSLKRDWKPWQDWTGRAILTVIIAAALFPGVFHLMWGRIRFRDLGPDFAGYTPWWLPRGPYWGLRIDSGFPSGHTAMAAILLPLLALVKRRSWKDPAKIAAWIAVICWVLLVAVSRVVIGAHFASDVLFSAGVGALCTIILFPEKAAPPHPPIQK